MLRSWKLGRAFGIDVYVHWSFLILPVVVIISTRSYGLVSAALALAFVVLAFACVTLHEYGHALAARVFGIGTHDIILMPIGGLARLERMSEEPHEEIVISVAGPCVNVVLALLLALGLILTGGIDRPDAPVANQTPFTSVRGLVNILLTFNIGMVIFNMAPAFPMDGGRVFRAFLALFVNRMTATRIAVFVGFGFAGLFVLLGISKNFMLIFLGLFVMLLGQLELAMVRRQMGLQRPAETDAAWQRMAEQREALLPPVPPEPDFSGYSWDPHSQAWVEWRDGWPVRKCGMRAW